MQEESSLRCDGSDLCAELSGSSLSDFARAYEGQPISRVLDESLNFATIADISPLVEGHLLVAPKAHHLNFASALRQHSDEGAAALASAAEWVRATYGLVALFEHGSTSDGAADGGACVLHAHVHVLPIPAGDLIEVMWSDNLRTASFQSVMDLRTRAASERAYLLCSDGDSFHIAFPSGKLRPQYLRAAVGSVLGIPDPEWDWSVVVRKHLLRATVDRYRAMPTLP